MAQSCRSYPTSNRLYYGEFLNQTSLQEIVFHWLSTNCYLFYLIFYCVCFIFLKNISLKIVHSHFCFCLLLKRTLIVMHYGGVFTYAFFAYLNWLQFIILGSLTFVYNLFLYMLGEAVNKLIWGSKDTSLKKLQSTFKYK